MKTKKGFTLIELLVVVLIIGILAAIAVPKYQIAVLKSEYSTLKAKTRAIAESVNRYKLATNNYPKEFSELDISLPDIKSTPRAQEGDTGFFIYFNDGASCTVWIKNYDKAKCILPSNKIHFYVDLNTLKPYLCYTQKDYETGHKVCQQETGKTREQATVNCGNNDSYCGYEY